jgi:CRISPR-associated protein Cmr3
MTTLLRLTPHDPLVARDGRPFGAGQGNRMRGLPWPLPSVVAGSFRTALVKAGSGDFSGDIPQRLMQIAVAGVFPVHDKKLYLPAPNDCVWDEKANKVHRVQPIKLEEGEGVDFPDDAKGLWPVRLADEQSTEDFKAKSTPAWWPLSKYTEWLTSGAIEYQPSWFSEGFLSSAIQSMRDHVALEADRGAAEEGKIFASSNLNVTDLPRFGVKLDDKKLKFEERFARVELSARVTIPESATVFKIAQQFGLWHPLGGERRMVHWQQVEAEPAGWNCPTGIRSALATATKVRMILATPAIFKAGWKPSWLTTGLEGELSGVKLKLVGASNGRWKAVSGWSLAPPRGPKPIRRMVPAGSVYFFEVEKPGDAAPLADLWLQSVSDDEQEQRDGFGLAVWGVW